MTKEEHEQALEKARWTECAQCSDKCRRFGEWYEEKSFKDFCSIRCKETHERATAPLYKPQPKRTKENTYGAYDI
jgi:hypothetical protein